MPARLLIALAVTCAALLLSGAVDSATETDLLERRVGFVGGKLGARVERVEDVAGRDEQRVTVSVPTNGGDKPQIEEVVVTAPRLKQEFRFTPRYEYLDNYEEGRYGFVIYLGESRDLPFRIYFADQPGPGSPASPY